MADDGNGKKKKKGGWYKSYDDELGDPKAARLSDFEFRIWRYCLDYCNRSPADLRRQGFLYHSKGFPVDASDFARTLGRTVDEAEEALQSIATIGGDSSLIVYENGVIRIRNWRKRQDGDEESEPDSCQVSAEVLPESCQNPADSLPKSCQNPDKIQTVSDAIYLDVDVRRKRKTKKEKDLPPDEPAAPNFQACVDEYCKGYEETVGSKTSPGGQGLKALRRKLLEVKSEYDSDKPPEEQPNVDPVWPRKVQAVIAFVVRGHDSYFKRSPPALATILSEQWWPQLLARATEYWRAHPDGDEPESGGDSIADDAEGIP